MDNNNQESKDLSFFQLDNFVAKTIKQVYDGLQDSKDMIAKVNMGEIDNPRFVMLSMNLTINEQRVSLELPIKVD